MNFLFEVVNNIPILTLKGEEVPELVALLDRDKSNSKALGKSELAVLYHMSRLIGPYSNLSESDKIHTLREIYMPKKLKDSWEPDDTFYKALDRYKVLSYSPEMRMLDAQLTMLNKFTEFFLQVDPNEKDTTGKLVHDPKKLMSMNTESSSAIERVEELREKVLTGESLQKERTRGGQTLNIFGE